MIALLVRDKRTKKWTRVGYFKTQAELDAAADPYRAKGIMVRQPGAGSAMDLNVARLDARGNLPR